MTIASEWDAFKAVDIAPNAPPTQLFEMRKAFYAGAASGIKLSATGTLAANLAEMLEYVAAEDVRRASNTFSEPK